MNASGYGTNDNHSYVSNNTDDDELSSLLTEKLGDTIIRAQFFRRLQRPEKAFKRAHFVPLNGRVALEEAIIKGGNEPDLNFVIKLGFHLVKAHFSRESQRLGALMMEWSYIRGVDFTLKEQLTLARAHYMIYLEQGIFCEQFNIRRSKELYLDLLKRADKETDGFIMTEDAVFTIRQEACHVLNACGDSETLVVVAQKTIDYINRNSDKGLATFALLRGGACKEIGNFEEAANCFFTALSSKNYPGRLTRMDMLFLITRNLNQLEHDKAKKDGRVYHENYEMIYLQLLQDKRIPKSVSYDEWLHDFNTWSAPALKLQLMGLHNLAADLIAQGFIHDYRVFQYPKAWWMFSKVHFRCCRHPDAKSSLAQALNFDSENTQYLRAARIWMQEPCTFEERMHTWTAAQICQALPPQSDFYLPSQKKLRGLLFIARRRNKEELVRRAEEERIRLREEAKQKLIEQGMAGETEGRQRIVKDRNKLNPKIEWQTPSAIIYPSKLTPKECNASCKDMEGSFEYFPGTDSLPLPAGEHTIFCVFTPNNTKKYNCVETSVVLIIKKATPLVKWKDPEPIYNGATLDTKRELNAKLVDHPNDLQDHDTGAQGKNKRKKRKQETMSFNVGNATQLVNAPDGTFEYYLDPLDKDIPLPPEDTIDIRLFNDDYYLEHPNENERTPSFNPDVIPWPRVEQGMRLPVGQHHVLCHFIPYDLTNYIRIRTFAFINVIPKLIPKISWAPPPFMLSYLTPLSEADLNARVDLKGKFKYYHCLNEEDVAEPAYQEEQRLIAFKADESKRVEAELVLMAANDLWRLRTREKASSTSAGENKSKSRKDAKTSSESGVGSKKTPKGKDSRSKRRDKSERERSPSPENRQKSATRTNTGEDNDTNINETSETAIKSSSNKNRTSDFDDQPCGEIYLAAMALTKKVATPGYILPSGICKMLCIFTPKDRLTYDYGVCFISIVVTQAVPVIEWPSDLPYVYNTDILGTAQMCARLTDSKDNSGAGTFVYTVTSVQVLKSEEDLKEEAETLERMRLRQLEIEQEDEEERLARLAREDAAMVAELNAAAASMPSYMRRQMSSNALLSARSKRPRGKYVNIESTANEGDDLLSFWHPEGSTAAQIGTLPKGHQSISVIYYPHDARNYTTATASAKFTVRCRPEILWEARYAEQLRHGLPVGEDQLCAYVTECAGEVTYTPEEGDVLEIGYYTVKAKFVPEDDSLHDIAYSSRPLQIIRKLIPQVSWDVKPILYREPITELNICTAISNVPGKFTYNMKYDQTLNAGSYSITCTFYPEDSITYALSTTVNQLVILPLQVEIEFQPEDPVLDLQLTYGEPLTDKQFCAHVVYPPESEVPSMFGEMSYSFAEGEYLPTGTNIMTATFKPLPPHDINYRAATARISIEMIKYIPRLQWEPPQAVVFGTGHLTMHQLNAGLVHTHIPPPGTANSFVIGTATS